MTSVPIRGSRTAEREQLLASDTAAFVGTPLIKDGRWVADIRRPQRDAADLDARSDRIG